MPYPPGPEKLVNLPDLAGGQAPGDLQYLVDVSAGTNRDRQSTLNNLFAELTKNVTERTTQFTSSDGVRTVSAANSGKIGYSQSAQSWVVSENGGAYQNLLKGSGVATRVAFWSAADELSSNSDFYWDNVNERLGIGVGSTPDGPIDVLADGTALAQQWRQNAGPLRVQMILDNVPEASLGTSTNHTFHLLSNNLQRLTVENGGLVGINKASVIQAQLQVVSQDATTETLILNSASLPSVSIAEFYNDNSLRFAFSPAGNLGIGLSGAGGATGSVTLNGVTSGAVTVNVAAAAGTWTLTLPTTDGNAGEFLQTNGSGVTTWATAGGGTPGSPVNSVQFNNAGAFGGDSAFLWDSANDRLLLGVAVASGQAPLDVLADGTALAQQWRQNAGPLRVQMILDNVPEASLGTSTNHTFHLLSNNLQRLTVENGGLVGINKASVIQAQLQVVSQDATTETLILNSASLPSVSIAEFYNDNSLRFAFSPAGNLGIGLSGAGGATGSVTLNGVTSGAVTVNVAAAAGTWSFTLPTTDGNAGEFLQTDGNGVTTWAAAGGATINPTNFVMPVRQDATTFIDSPLSVASNAVTMTRSAIGATSSDGLILLNATAAAAGAQQYSPRLRFTGQGWKTNATAASQTVDWVIENQPVQGAAAPTLNLVFASQVNGGGFTTKATFTSNGTLVLANPAFSVANAIAMNDVGFGQRTTVNGLLDIMVGSTPMAEFQNGGGFVLNPTQLPQFGFAPPTFVSVLDTAFARQAANVFRVTNGSTGLGSILIGVSTDSLTGNFTVLGSNAATNSIVTVARLGVNSTGTAADGFGSALSWSAETSTTNDTETARNNVFWTTATHASRTSAASWSLVNNGTLAEVMRLTTPSAIVGSPFVLNIHDGTNPNVWTSGSFAAKLYLISPTLPAVGVAAHFSATAVDAPQWQMLRGRGTNASPTAIQASDSLGNIEWWGQTSTSTNNVVAGARIRVSATENWSAGNNGCDMFFFVSNNAATITERMSLVRTGTLRIGATSGSTSTDNKLQVGNYASWNSDAVAAIYTDADDNKGLEIIGTATQTADLLRCFNDSVTPDKLTLSAAGKLTTHWLNWNGEARVSTQFDKTSDTTLANITGLTINVVAGRTYSFKAVLYTSSNVAGGVKAAIAGTATATAIRYEAVVIDNALIAAQTRATALGTAVGAVTAVTAAMVIITGTITVNAAGTLTVQFAQNASNAAASSVLTGSVFIADDVP